MLVPGGQAEAKRLAYRVVEAASPSDSEWEAIVKVLAADMGNQEVGPLPARSVKNSVSCYVSCKAR